MATTGVQHPASHPLDWGVIETEWNVEDSLSFVENSLKEILFKPKNGFLFSERASNELNASIFENFNLSDLFESSLKGMPVSALNFSQKTSESIVFVMDQDHILFSKRTSNELNTSISERFILSDTIGYSLKGTPVSGLSFGERTAESLVSFVDQDLVADVVGSWKVSATMMEDAAVGQEPKGQLVKKFEDQLELTDDQTHKLEQILTQAVNPEEIKFTGLKHPAAHPLTWDTKERGLRYKMAFDKIDQLDPGDQVGISLAKRVFDDMNMDTQTISQIIETFPEQLELAKGDDEYTIETKMRQYLKPEANLRIALVDSILQEMNLTDNAVKMLEKAYSDELDLTEKDAEYSLNVEVEENVDLDVELVCSFIAEMVQELGIGDEPSPELVTLFADSLLLDEEEVYELLKEVEEDLSLDDYIRLVGAVELVLNIRDRIAQKERIMDRIELEKEVK